MSISWGISALSHDAALTVMDGEYILFAAHAERYSRIKNDAYLNREIIQEALSYGVPEKIFWYERPYLKKTRQAFAGQWQEVFKGETPKKYLRENFPELKGIPIGYVDHHLSHAAAGFFTSPFERAKIIVVDGIGEWDTATIWEGNGNEIKKIKSVKYPHSLGIFYSAITQRVGLKPLEDEYILMGMAAYGDLMRAMQLRVALEQDFFAARDEIKLKKNLHRGILDWKPELRESDYPSLALAAQQIVEDKLKGLFSTVYSEDIVFMGGVALNCVANSRLAAYCNKLWIMPNPGDAGSSMGAVLAGNKTRAVWEGPYLGTNIDRKFDYEGALQELVHGSGIIAIANGRAEFGPRALGNRSLIADPRGQHMKDRVNDIKQRQRFRPFAPVIMEQHVTEYFKFPLNVNKSPYMQYVGKCKYPYHEQFPAICHQDNSARIQTVTPEQNPVLYRLLAMFKEATGCPMLLNTSLNIKGEPLVNTWEDALRFSQLHGVKVF